MPAKMSLDGKQVHDANDPRAKGLIAYNALLGYALPPEDAEFFVKELWDMKIPSGNYRYYDGCIYLMALAHASGKFKLKDW
jgi:oligosaccharide reducing-end xylanase